MPGSGPGFWHEDCFPDVQLDRKEPFTVEKHLFVPSRNTIPPEFGQMGVKMALAASTLVSSVQLGQPALKRATRYSVSVRNTGTHAVQTASALVRQGSSSVFQSPDWLAAFLDTIGSARKLEFFQIEVSDRSGRNILILPFVSRECRGFRVLEMPDFGLADYVAPLVADRFRASPRMMRRIWSQVRLLLPPADLVRFVKMPAEIGGIANPLLGLDGVRRSALSAWGVPLGPAETIWNSAIPCEKRRRDLDARWRKFNKRGKVTFETATDPGMIDLFFDELCRQRAERFGPLGFPNALDHAEVRAFYRALLDARSGPAPAVVQALRVDGTIVAAGYGVIGNGAYHMIFPTFQAEGWRNYSPGLHLFRKSMQWAAEQGLTYYDFTVGAESFKRDFGACERQLWERYEALSMRGLGAVAGLALKHFARTHPRLSRAVRAARSLVTRKGA